MDMRQFSSDKILKHLDRVNAWLNGENPFPITVELDVTNVCNHHCPECVGRYFQDKNYDSLPLKLAREIVRQLAHVQVCGLIFTGGGEPLCYPRLKELITLARKLGLDIGFITNGSLITDDIAKTLLRNCTWIRVSLDAASQELFEKIHGLNGYAFDRVIENINLLTKTKKRLKSHTTVGIGYLTSDFTKDDMYRMTLLSKKLGVDYLQFRPLQIHLNGKFAYRRMDIAREIEKCLRHSNEKFKVLYSQHKYEMMRDKDYGRNYKKCYGHQFATVIGADAKVYICCHMRGNAKYCIGDLNKSTFIEIWNSPRRRKVAENIAFKDCIPLCRDNTFNQILWNIKQPREHENFL